jgi:large subunit ribosomal protein L6
MSRLGKLPVTLPKGVEATCVDGVLTVKGPKGTLSQMIKKEVAVTLEDGAVTLVPTNDSKAAGALWGTYASIVRSHVLGVTEGFVKKLEIEGVGYRAESSGQKLSMNLGFSHPVVIQIPEGISVTVEKGLITITGIDKHAVGQFAANVRKVKKPEPYKGKGIRYQGEHIIRKQGKKAV